ncbi:flagellar protein FlaG [Solibacillus sp. FSL H8-0538]|uniref:flagellar protein FlaG n=1 Tax=Solibacillus sp. FSL H8-0538 TaxID=2921400 RepID=UPI0030F57329
MRITSQNTEATMKMSSLPLKNNSTVTQMEDSKVSTLVKKDEVKLENSPEQSKTNSVSRSDQVTKDKLEEAVASINEFIHTEKKNSKFVLHEGLDKYYVRLVDADTDELIKEIPPERLLDAFYEMQKLAGMIVDEKI